MIILLSNEMKDSLFGSLKTTKPAAKALVILGAPAPAGSCEFVGAFLSWEASKLRLCQIDGCVCFLVC